MLYKKSETNFILFASMQKFNIIGVVFLYNFPKHSRVSVYIEIPVDITRHIFV